ncbi:MAG: Uma2 family endonuclease [Anaerolineae bacterium]|nr:Uma2 family endonuclease [Anaerolineae bacterium]
MNYPPSKEAEQEASATLAGTARSQHSASVPEYPVYRFTVDQYHEMISTGILTDDDPIELLEGWLIPKMSKNPPHALATRLLRMLFTDILPDGWFVDSQEPISTADSEPEPDVAIVRGNIWDYANHHPQAKDVALVVEVADATLQRDRSIKKRLYAAAGIPMYWIVNLVDNQVEVYTEPSGTGERAAYRQQQVYGVNDEVPVVVDGRTLTTIPAQEILP